MMKWEIKERLGQVHKITKFMILDMRKNLVLLLFVNFNLIMKNFSKNEDKKILKLQKYKEWKKFQLNKKFKVK